MPRLPADARRAALVEAALRVMSRGGLAAGTTRAIVAEAGMSLASFHYAFSSRDDLLRELVHRVVGHELSAATAELPAGAGPAECLRAAAAGYLDHLEREPGAEQLMLELALHCLRDPALRPLARQQYRAYTAAATRLLEQVAAATGVAWRRPAPELARLLVTLLDGATTTWLVDRDTAATRAVLDAAVELFVAQHADLPGMRTVAEVRAPVGRAWTVRFGLVWLGLWAAQLAPVQLLLPLQLADVDPVHKVRDFGLVNGLAGLAALVALPVFGALCDRTTSPFGRRRVWVAAGVAVYTVGLLLTAAAGDWRAVAGAWLVAQLGMYAAIAGLTATISDQVPPGQRGAVSAAVYGPQALGVVLGLLLVIGVGSGAGYPALAVVLLLAAVPWLLRARDAAPAGPGPSLPDAVRAMWSAPSRHPDYAWAFGGWLLVNLGNALGTTYLLYFLTDGLRVADPEGSLLVLTVVYLVATVAATWGGGVWSDRTGRRRVFVAGAAVLQALACAVLVAVPSWPSALLAGVLLGAGYGCYTSVDQALVTQVLPDARTVAGDLGVMNVAVVAPQALAPLLASLVIAELGGYDVLFALAGTVTVLGALSVARIRSVR